MLEVAGYLPSLRSMMSEDAEKFLDDVLSGGNVTRDLPTYIGALARRHRVAQAWSIFLDRNPLILGPISTRQAFVVGEDLNGVEAVRRIIKSMVLTEACNLLGLPAVAVPVAVIDGLPQGVQLIARRFHDELCLDAAELIEKQHGVFVPIDPA